MSWNSGIGLAMGVCLISVIAAASENAVAGAAAGAFDRCMMEKLRTAEESMTLGALKAECHRLTAATREGAPR